MNHKLRKKFMLRYHFQGKIVLWGMAIVLFSSIASEFIAKRISPHLIMYIDSGARRAFVTYLPDVLTTILFFLIASICIIATSKPMVKRVLDLSLAAQEIARGNFNVRVSEQDRYDEVYQLARDFNLMAAELRNNDYLRKDFISSVSHEMKTPLAVIGGYADLLKSPNISDEDRLEYVSVISREVARLRTMCGNMLNISRLNHCELLEGKSSYSLDEQLRQAILLLEPKWSEKDIAFDINLPELEIFANEGLMQDVWINLLDNAIKFCDEDGRIGVNAGISGKQFIWVSIQDNGIGMSEENSKRIFEQFFQVEHSYAKEGAGLGLAIVKRIVELHKGSIHVVSRLGQGTTVTVKIPVESFGNE